MPKITDYEPIAGSHTIEELRLLAGKLQGKVIQNVNSTAVGVEAKIMIDKTFQTFILIT